MEKARLGDIFEIETSEGKAYLHFIHRDKEIGELVRVLRGLYKTKPDNLDDITESNERFLVYFPLTAAAKRKIVQKVGNSQIRDFSKPKYMRTEHFVRGVFLGWHIIDTDTWERQFVKELTTEQIKLSPWGIWNDTLLKEKLEDGWTLDKWY